jgi:aminoglycoside phosphotransferase (APT) family kinase protein
MQFDKGRDFDAAKVTLEDWLCKRLDLERATVTELILPDRAGLSNETLLFRAELDDGATTRTEELVARISPAPAFQLCRDPLFEEQARLLQVLHDERHLEVPNVRWFEDDPKWFDRPFFVMDRVHGRVPLSDPIYNAEGWLFDATPVQQHTAWAGALDELIRVNQTPPDLVRFLPGGTSGFPEVLDSIRAEYAWACAGVEHKTVDHLWEWLEANVPSATPLGLSWGDARLGNTMFDEDFHLVLVMDWELASLGTPIMDLGWWLFFDDVHSETVPRLPGLGSREETIERWQQGTGLRADDLEWYEILAAVRLATLVTEPNDTNAFTRLAYQRLGWSL